MTPCFLLFVVTVATTVSSSTPLTTASVSPLVTDEFEKSQECKNGNDPTSTCGVDNIQTQPIHPGTANKPRLNDDNHHPHDASSNPPPPLSNLKKYTLLSPFSYESRTVSAQAYKPNTPVSKTVCEIPTSGGGGTSAIALSDYKLANRFSFWRSEITLPPPIVRVRGRLLDVACGEPCHHIPRVEVWQARPDGTYSSIAPESSTKDDENISPCRATIPIVSSSLNHSKSFEFEFETLAPGSTGVLGGLGPAGFDIPPWKYPPVIHIMSWIDGYQLSLIEIPIPFVAADGANTLKDQSFGWGRVSSEWNNNINELELIVDIYMKQNDQYRMRNLRDVLCQHSEWYASPQSFSMEPIALCRPFMLDFFPL